MTKALPVFCRLDSEKEITWISYSKTSETERGGRYSFYLDTKTSRDLISQNNVFSEEEFKNFQEKFWEAVRSLEKKKEIVKNWIEKFKTILEEFRGVGSSSLLGDNLLNNNLDVNNSFDNDEFDKEVEVEEKHNSEFLGEVDRIYDFLTRLNEEGNISGNTEEDLSRFVENMFKELNKIYYKAMLPYMTLNKKHSFDFEYVFDEKEINYGHVSLSKTKGEYDLTLYLDTEEQDIVKERRSDLLENLKGIKDVSYVDTGIPPRRLYISVENVVQNPYLRQLEEKLIAIIESSGVNYRSDFENIFEKLKDIPEKVPAKEFKVMAKKIESVIKEVYEYLEEEIEVRSFFRK